MEKKYKLTEEYTTIGGKKLYRIEALKDFSDVKKGDKGGFVESKDNLSQYNNCWVYDDAMVYINAKICDNAKVYGKAIVHGDSEICDDTIICGKVNISNADINGNAKVASTSDYIVFKNWWSSGRYFTWTRSNNMWSVGCFYGTGEELIAKAYKDSELSGREYKRVVKYVESIINEDRNYDTRRQRTLSQRPLCKVAI